LTAVRYGERLSGLVFSGSSEVLLLSLFGITLVVAGLAERIQLSAAVGAFLVGVSLSGEAASAGRALLLPLRNLFAAVFFVFFGLQVDPSLIPDVALLAGGLALVTAVTKVVTGWWAAKQAGVARRGRLRAGSALIARGEFSIVIATLGVGLEPGLGALSATYVIFLAILGPIVTRLSDPIAELPGIRRIGRDRVSETNLPVPSLPTGHP
ncbi:MAG TPA: cation:proton antiporter, partial [Acidimicrobiales bacterium]|nr:cation:proton antiporter [Acidimicrobiales bacterium]